MENSLARDMEEKKAVLLRSHICECHENVHLQNGLCLVLEASHNSLNLSHWCVHSIVVSSIVHWPKWKISCKCTFSPPPCSHFFSQKKCFAEKTIGTACISQAKPSWVPPWFYKNGKDGHVESACLFSWENFHLGIRCTLHGVTCVVLNSVIVIWSQVSIYWYLIVFHCWIIFTITKYYFE